MPEIGQGRELGQLLKTGQTTKYALNPDDGNYRKGLSKLYTILTAGRYAGTTNITINAKTDVHSNNCVYDQRTKLMWSRYVAATIGPIDNGKMPWTAKDPDGGIFTFVAAANAALLAGYSDWRIPNCLELASLANLETPNALPDPTAFPSWPSTVYVYSSTTQPSTTTSAIGFSYGTGAMGGVPKTQNQWIALVRG